jgi:hypothetical protein
MNRRIDQGEKGSDASHRTNENDIGRTGSGIRMRAVCLGLILAIALCSITPLNNVYHKATPLGGGHFPLAPFFILLWLTLLVALVNRVFRSRTWLTGRELLVVWILMALVSGIAYTGLVRTFFINLTAPYHFASPGNRWDEVLHPLLPRSLYPQSREAIEALYNGLAGGQTMGWLQVLQKVPWDAWLQPLVVWTILIFLCYTVMICLVNLLSRQWLENERMNFPLLQVPLLLEEAVDRNGLGRFFTNRFLVAGLFVPLFLHLINGLHFYYPTVPQIPTLILAGPYFPKYGLFSGFHNLKLYIYPAFIGFAFLASKQISFSFWFFFIMGGLLIGLLNLLGYNIPAATLGITFGPTLSRPEETQMIGAYGVFFLFTLWLARRHLLVVLRQAFGFEREDPSLGAWFSVRLSFWGFIIATAGIVIWCHSFGMTLWNSLWVVAAFFVFVLVVSRVICQGGIAYFTLTVAPLDGLIAFFGPRLFTSVGILIAAVVQKVLFVDMRESLMPSLLHTSKITHTMGRRRMIFAAISITLAAGVVASFLAMLALCYKFGVRQLQLDWATRTTAAVYENIYSLVESPVKPGHWVMVFSIMGALVTLILVIFYHRFYWWPLHPIGYLTTYSSAMRILWFSFLVGWLCNVLCMRYGGVQLFKMLRYLFLGLIIGDFLMGGVWILVGFFGYESFQVLPG